MISVFAAMGIFIATFGGLMLVSWLCGKCDDDHNSAWLMSTFISAMFITLMFIYYEF